jgi:hypothetical protein
MIGIKGKGTKVIDIPPMKLSEYGKLPYDSLKLMKFRLRGVEDVRAGSYIQYNLYLNKNVIAAFVDYASKECFVVVNEKETKDTIAKLIHNVPSYTGSKALKYAAEFESEEEADYTDILKSRFNLELVD